MFFVRLRCLAGCMPIVSPTVTRIFSGKKDHFGVINSQLGMLGSVDSQTEHVSDIEAALLDAELFMKYQAPDRAIKSLRTALEVNSRSIKLRERLREICASLTNRSKRLPPVPRPGQSLHRARGF